MRNTDWRLALEAEIQASMLRTHEWGTHDCLQFCARAVLAMTGVDHSEEFPAYDSGLGAAKILVDHDGIAGLLTGLFGEPCAPNLARCGDVVLAVVDGIEAAGMCLGTKCAFVHPEAGLVFPSREIILQAWRVD